MEKPIKLYIDTSVWNFALETERKDSILTNEFLQLINSENYTVIVSDTIAGEITAAFEPRKTQLQELLKSFDCKNVFFNNEAEYLANVYIEEKLIPLKEFNDALHIAIATVNRCDFIVSWNFQHMVRAKVIMGVHHINHKEGYGLIEIVSPEQFLGKKE